MLPRRFQHLFIDEPIWGIGGGFVLAAILTAVMYYPRGPQENWDSADYIQMECGLAGEIAVAIASSRDLGEPIISNPEISYSPQLSGSSYGVNFNNSRYWTRWLVPEALPPKTIDCSSEFTKYWLALAGLPLRAPDYLGPEKYRLSRISISPEGGSATVRVSMICGSVCGYGWRTLRKRQAGRWVLMDKAMLRIS